MSTVSHDEAELVAAQRFAWYAEHDFTTEDGVIDKGPLRVKIAEVLASKARVKDRSERSSKSLSKGALAGLIFQNGLVTREAFEAATAVEQQAWVKIIGEVFSEAQPNESSAVQRMVGDDCPGYVLCRTKLAIDGNPTDAVYITTDEKLIMADFAGPLETAQRNAAAKLARNMAMIGRRQPTLAARSGRVVTGSMRQATALAKTTFVAALGHDPSASESADDAE